MALLRADRWGVYCVSCYRGSSTIVTDLYVSAWSWRDAINRVRAAGWTPAT